MVQLAIPKDFLASYAGLERSAQGAVDAAMAKFAEHTRAGLHLEKLRKSLRLEVVLANLHGEAPRTVRHLDLGEMIDDLEAVIPGSSRLRMSRAASVRSGSRVRRWPLISMVAERAVRRAWTSFLMLVPVPSCR